MKKLKKILAFVMAMAMVLGMSVTTFATSNDLNNGDKTVGLSTDTGKIVVHGIEEPGREDVKAYLIMKAQYDKNRKFVGYDQSLVTEDNVEKNQINADFLDTLYENSVKDKISAVELSWVDSTKTYEASNLPVGMYMIVIPSNDSVTYSKAVASIYYTNDGSSYIFNNADLTLSTTTEDGKTWVKKDVSVQVEKTVEEAAGNTANVGDVLQYEISIPKVPNFTGAYPYLEVTDTLSNGLLYQNDAEVFVIEGTTESNITSIIESNISYTAPAEGKKAVLKVNFVSKTGESEVATYDYLLKDYAGKKVVIRYSAKLTEDALRNGKNNGNEVELDYTRDSSKKYGDPGTEPENPPKDETHTYTFDIDGQADAVDNLTNYIITKYGEEKDSETQLKKALEGATFTLYTNNGSDALERDAYKTEEEFRAAIVELNQKYTTEKADGSTYFDGTTTSDANGQVKIVGLAAGTYYLKETAAPEDYSVNDHVFEIIITATQNEVTGLLESWGITIDDESVANFKVDNQGISTLDGEKKEVAIQNMKLSSLPSTGGIGTTIFTIGGCAIMILAAGLFFASRRKSAK